jgi:cadmium resistance protein CadD (predicted permease)
MRAARTTTLAISANRRRAAAARVRNSAALSRALCALNSASLVAPVIVFCPWQTFAVRSIWQAVGLFAVTNIDDIVVLSIFFGRAGKTPRAGRAIVVGQYLGFGAILAASVAGASGANLLPGNSAAYLGLMPIALGVHAIWRARRSHTDPDEDSLKIAGARSPWVVAAVTIANGGDNIGVYIPAFTGHAPAVLGGYVGVFLLLVGVWCAIGYYLTRHSIIAGLIGRWGEIIYPAALIAIGLAILITGDAFGM